MSIPGRIEPGSLGIKDGRIVTPYAAEYEALEVIDAGMADMPCPGSSTPMFIWIRPW